MLHATETADLSEPEQDDSSATSTMTPGDVSHGISDIQMLPHCKSKRIPRCLAIHPSGTELAVGDREVHTPVYGLIW